MSDVIQPASIQAPTKATTPASASAQPTATVSTNPLGPLSGADLAKYTLNGGQCDALQGSRRVQGVTVRIYPQCGDLLTGDAPFVEIPCDLQGTAGVDWMLKSKTAMIETACAMSSGIPYLTGFDASITVDINANGVYTTAIYDLLMGSTLVSPNVSRQSGAKIRTCLVELIDTVNRVRIVVPSAFLMPESDLKLSAKNAVTGKLIIHMVPTTDPVTGEMYFSETTRY